MKINVVLFAAAAVVGLAVSSHSEPFLLSEVLPPEVFQKWSEAYLFTQRADDNLIVGRTAEAISAYLQALDQKPDLYSACAGLGKAYMLQGDYLKAAESFRRTLVPRLGERVITWSNGTGIQGPGPGSGYSQPETVLRFAVCTIKSGQREDAIQAYNHGLDLVEGTANEKDWRTFLMAPAELAKQAPTEKAATEQAPQEIRHGLKVALPYLDNSNRWTVRQIEALSWLVLGLTYKNDGYPNTKQEEYIKIAASLEPQIAEIQYYLGDALWVRYQYEETVAAYQKAALLGRPEVREAAQSQLQKLPVRKKKADVP